jgi:hypothetical protein
MIDAGEKQKNWPLSARRISVASEEFKRFGRFGIAGIANTIVGLGIIAALDIGMRVRPMFTALAAAKAWLTEMLGTGAVRVPFLQDMAKQAGRAWPTMERAKTALRVQSVKMGAEGWTWQMPR